MKLVVIFLLFISGSLLAHSQTRPMDLSYDWQISFEDKQLTNSPINVLWRSLDTKSEGSITVNYERKFELPDNLMNKDLIFVVPNSWVPKTILINDRDYSALDGESGVGTYIYRKRILLVKKELLDKNNEIKITSTGNKYLGGFRTADFEIRPASQGILDLKINQFIYNDIHSGFIVLSLVIGTICLFVSVRIKDDRKKNAAIAIASFSLIPYHLLTTNFYGIFFTDSTAPFRFQLVFQALTWLAWAYYLALVLKRDSIFSKIVTKRSPRIMIVYFLLLAASSVFAPFHLFQALLMPAFVLPAIIIIPWWLSLKGENPLVVVASGIAILLAYATLASDVFSLNYYFSGYSVALFTSISLFFFLKNYLRSSIRLKSTSGFINYLLLNQFFNKSKILLKVGLTSSKFEVK
ncbi:MAG: hypothetical protein R2827_07570 [Bdellovibrionales bacterium]